MLPPQDTTIRAMMVPKTATYLIRNSLQLTSPEMVASITELVNLERLWSASTKNLTRLLNRSPSFVGESSSSPCLKGEDFIPEARLVQVRSFVSTPASNHGVEVFH